MARKVATRQEMNEEKGSGKRRRRIGGEREAQKRGAEEDETTGGRSGGIVEVGRKMKEAKLGVYSRPGP